VTGRTLCAIPVCLLFVPSVGAAQDVVDVAVSLIGRPYVWGAEGPGAFDCSGLTQYVYQQFGVELPRRAISQSRVGGPVGRRLQRGDLLFFSENSRQSLVTHVGIYEGRGWMIEASKRYGKVRRSELNDAYWADRLMFGRRVTSPFASRDSDEGEIDRPRDLPPDRPASRPRIDKRRVAAQALQRVAEALLRRPRR
jgi:NlpC/P60 family